MWENFSQISLIFFTRMYFVHEQMIHDAETCRMCVYPYSWCPIKYRMPQTSETTGRMSKNWFAKICWLLRASTVFEYLLSMCISTRVRRVIYAVKCDSFKRRYVQFRLFQSGFYVDVRLEAKAFQIVLHFYRVKYYNRCIQYGCIKWL